MISIFCNSTGTLIRNCVSINGENMKGKRVAYCPADFERMRWDASARAWVDCEVAAAAYRERMSDDAYRACHGADSINQARRRLAAEAALWLAFGNETACPLLKAEAAMRSISLDQLAAIVRAHDEQWIADEVARKQRKIGD